MKENILIIGGGIAGLEAAAQLLKLGYNPIIVEKSDHLGGHVAEWNRLKFYVSAGAMTEVNLAGKVHTELYGGDEFIQAFDEDRRMKEWLWSVNARLGLNYPLVGALAVYGEVGADYYFDNGSSIETIRSERPFNVSLQFGLRFGL